MMKYLWCCIHSRGPGKTLADFPREMLILKLKMADNYLRWVKKLRIVDHVHICSSAGCCGLWNQAFRATLQKPFLRRLTHGCFSLLMISGALLPKNISDSVDVSLGWNMFVWFPNKVPPPIWYVSTPSGRILARHGKISRKELEKRLAGIKAEGEEGQVKS